MLFDGLGDLIRNTAAGRVAMPYAEMNLDQICRLTNGGHLLLKLQRRHRLPDLSSFLAPHKIQFAFGVLFEC